MLAAELAESGIGVPLLAPGPVRTRLGSSSRNRAAAAAGGEPGHLRDADLSAGDGGGGLRWIDPAAAAAAAIAAIRADRHYAITHPDWKDVVVQRHRRIEAAFDSPDEAGDG